MANVRGFSVNVSNYYTTSQSISYANSVKSGVGGSAQFVIDTSRNANGSNGNWCNPAGRKLGVTAQAGGGAEMLLWVKTPGVSDGECGIAPTVPHGDVQPGHRRPADRRHVKRLTHNTVSAYKGG